MPAALTVSPPEKQRRLAGVGRIVRPGKKSWPAEDVALALGQPDGRAGGLGQLGERAEVVVVAVREQDRAGRRAVLLEGMLDLGGLFAGVDHGGFRRVRVGPDEVAIRPDLAEGEQVDGEGHGRMSLSLALVQSWDRWGSSASGTRDPMVVHSGNEARAVAIVLTPGQRLGDHQVKENAWITVLEGSATVVGRGRHGRGDARVGSFASIRTSATRSGATRARGSCCCLRRGPVRATTAAQRPRAVPTRVAGMEERKRIGEPCGGPARASVALP